MKICSIDREFYKHSENIHFCWKKMNRYYDVTKRWNERNDHGTNGTGRNERNGQERPQNGPEFFTNKIINVYRALFEIGETTARTF